MLDLSDIFALYDVIQVWIKYIIVSHMLFNVLMCYATLNYMMNDV